MIFGMVLLMPSAEAQLQVEKHSRGEILFPDIIVPFSLSYLSLAIVTTNIGIFFIWFLHTRQKSSVVITRFLKNILAFDLRQTSSYIVLACITVVYIGFTLPEIYEEEYDLGDYDDVKRNVENWPNESGILASTFFPTVNFLLLKISLSIFGNIRILPFLSSIILIILTYELTCEITKKKFPGILATVVLLQSNTFLTFDTTATYATFWIVFYLSSVFLIIKTRRSFALFAYMFSFFAKPLTIVFMPMNIYKIIESKSNQRGKVLVILPYVVIATITTFAISLGIVKDVDFTGFQFGEFFGTLYYFKWQYPETYFYVAIIPLIVGLYVIHKKGSPHAISIMIMIFLIMASQMLLVAITSVANSNYRLVILSVFVAIATGVLLDKRERAEVHVYHDFSTIIFILTMLLTVSIVSSIIFPQQSMTILNQVTRVMNQ